MEKRNYFAEENKGKRFFVNGQEVTYKKAIDIDEMNRKYMSSHDVADWANITFITII